MNRQIQAIVVTLICTAMFLVGCTQSERVETSMISSVSITPHCPTCREIDAYVSPGCFSSSKTKPISQHATVQIDQQQRVLTFTGRFVYENLWISGPYNADCGGAGYAVVPVGTLAPGTYTVMAGTQKLGIITIPEAGSIPWQQVEISQTHATMQHAP